MEKMRSSFTAQARESLSNVPKLERRDSIAALEECRLAIEKVVDPDGRPVELLPRSEKVLAIQSDLVKRYNLHSDVFGKENQQRLRVYPP